MSLKFPQRDPIAAAKRKSVANRRIGIGGQCAFCGETRPTALIGGSSPLTCEECRRRKEGKSIFDDHHVAGKSNHPLTIPIPANDHRAYLSERQYDWPKQTRENPDGSPLRSIAGRVRGHIDSHIYLLTHLLNHVPDSLEELDDFLASEFGPKWWASRKFAEFKSRKSGK